MTNQTSLRARALNWLRTEMHVLPLDGSAQRQGVRDDERRATIDGTIIEPSRGASLAYPGLYMMTAASVIGMAASRHGLAVAVRDALMVVALALLAVAVVLLVMAWRARPRRTEVRVELFGGPAPEPDELEALRADGPARAIWLVCDAPWRTETVAAAGALGMRCFTAQGTAFVAQ